jgi:ribonuclease HI
MYIIYFSKTFILKYDIITKKMMAGLGKDRIGLTMNVYIDGACINNGQTNAKAAYAVWFGHNDLRNESGPVIGKQSNNTGELTAFIRCLEIIQETGSTGPTGPIDIHCDSEYVIKCVTTYGTKLQASNWKTSTGKEPPNVELVQKAFALYQQMKQNLRLHYIRAHTGKTDEHSVGNAEVDRMANAAANESAGRPVDTSEHQIIKLSIPFANKDKAKELGARWDINKKCWYVNTKYVQQESVEALMELQQTVEPSKPDKATETTKSTETKKYIKISYANKNRAKNLGARWDAGLKSWYYIEEYISDDNKAALNSLANK